MNFLRKCLGRARISCSNRDDSGDNNEPNKQSVDSKSVVEHTQNRKLRDPVNECMVKMLVLIREFAIFCLVFIAYAAITNDPPKISKAPAAYPFFAKNSLIKDFYRGQIIAAVEHARTTDMSFIMFYAPWDAESQFARKEFLIAADYMKDHIIFTAVNCWQPNSECRNQYSKVYRWPVLIVYPSFGTGIQYNGPISAPHMINFLQKLMMPVKRINESQIDFEEGYVVAELNALPGSVEYSIYYTTALKYLETDPLGRISFYVKPVKYSQKKLLLYLWKHVIDIQPLNWNVETILQLIIKNSETPSAWVAPPGSKSLMMSDHLQARPSLILFTPKNPLRSSTDYYMMLQEIAQKYKNCENLILNFDMRAKRLRNLLEHQKLKSSCHVKQKFPKAKKISSVTTGTTFLNSSTRMNQNSDGNLKVPSDLLGLSGIMTHVCQSIKMGECFDIIPPLTGSEDRIDSKNEDSSVESWEKTKVYSTSMLQQDSDPKSMQNLRKTFRKNRCKVFLAAEKIHPPLFDPYDNEPIEVPNLACFNPLNSNQSLNFVAMDSLMYYVFAERLGIDLMKKRDKSAVVILNEQMETHYIMQEPIASKNIRIFITKFSNNTLPRSLDSVVDVPSQNTPSHTIKKNDDSDPPMVHVAELNSKNFLNVVSDKTKTVLVMYYSKQCSYCNGISYVFLTVARKLLFVENILFARIDGDLNILPWEFTMEEFPTILFFPSNRKEETRVFPSDILINVPNLLGFILANVNASVKLHVMYSVCLSSQLQKDKESCLSTIRNETLALIEKTLKDWRKSNNRQRQLLLHNLKQLRQLQFLFSHSPDDYLVIESYFKKLKVYLSDDYTTNSSGPVKDEL